MASRISILLGFLALSSSLLASKAVKEAKSFGKASLKGAKELQQAVRREDFLSESEKGEVFDGKRALERQDESLLDAFQMPCKLDEEEYLFERSEAVLEDPESCLKSGRKEEKKELFYKSLLRSGSPFPASFERSLSLDTSSETLQLKKICLGHSKKEHWPSRQEAEERGKRLLEGLSKDGTIAKAEKRILKRRGIHSDRYKLVVSYAHVEDCPSCRNFRTEEKRIPSEQEIWTAEESPAAKLFASQKTTLLATRCLDSSPRWIEGKEVSKACWRERVSFLVHPEEPEAEPLPEGFHAEEVGRRCVRETPFGCLLWQVDYRLFKSTVSKQKEREEPLFGTDEALWASEEEENGSFDGVFLKLSLFEEIERDLGKTGSALERYPIFQGSKKTCSKSLLDKVLYDCCSPSKGFAEKVKLSQCSAEEMALSEMKELGLCRFIGEKKGKFLNAWESRREGVYCCFSSKLARLFQEQAREQLGLSWGSAKKPECRGLSAEELSDLDFSLIDLGELKEGLKHKEIKLDQFEQKLKTLKREAEL